ncbi:hypothetical protein AAMO2058_000071800 [Amorphochlora amoebiformis]
MGMVRLALGVLLGLSLPSKGHARMANTLLRSLTAASVSSNRSLSELRVRYPHRGEGCQQGRKILDAFIDLTMPVVQKWTPNCADPSSTAFAAVIVEMRPERAFPWVVKTTMKYLGPSWALYVFHGTQNRDYVRSTVAGQNVQFVQAQVGGKPIMALNQQSYGYYLTMNDFWTTFPPNIKKILIFQSDSVALRPYTPEEAKKWVKFDYIGAPWDFSMPLFQNQRSPYEVISLVEPTNDKLVAVDSLAKPINLDPEFKVAAHISEPPNPSGSAATSPPEARLTAEEANKKDIDGVIKAAQDGVRAIDALIPKSVTDNQADSNTASPEPKPEPTSSAVTSEAKAKDTKASEPKGLVFTEISETKMRISEPNMKTSETKAEKTSESKAKTSEPKAEISEPKAVTSESKAETSESKADISEPKAEISEPTAMVNPGTAYYAGNGGFSMRSVEASKSVLDCVRALDNDPKAIGHIGLHMEDQLFMVCLLRNGYRVSKGNEAASFSVESLQSPEGYTPFGMHQSYCYQPDREFARLLATSRIAKDCGVMGGSASDTDRIEYLLMQANKRPL